MDLSTTSAFLVTGCARSGTGYAARLFTELGAPCAHEGVFSPRMRDRDDVLWPPDSPGESSWIAAPYVPGLPEVLPVLHQVRHPLAVVRSKLRTRFFELPSWYKSFAEGVLPELLEGSAAERALRYWVRWNALVEEGARTAQRPYRRYRLEDLGPELLVDLCGFVGHPVDADRARRAGETVSSDYNTRGDRGDDELRGWEDLPPSPLIEEARALAARYGYAD